MYKGYNLKLESRDFRNLRNSSPDGKGLRQTNESQVRETLANFLDKDGILNAKTIVNSWFPFVDAPIFISHSHADAVLANDLADWLKAEFSLNSFIDSAVWGYAPDLLKSIDDKYCRDEKKEIYIYSKRNHSTAHVHTMLTVALAQMIDKAECVFFLNTPSSIDSANSITSSTHSPWLYSEIAMTQLLRKSFPVRKNLVKSANESVNDELSLRYDLNLNHLIEIDFSFLNEWNSACERENLDGQDALDKLYSLDKENFNE